MAGRGRAWSEGGSGGGQGGRETKEGEVDGGEQVVREGVKEEVLREGREERNEGGGRYRGSAWTEGGSEGGRKEREGEK